MLELPPVYQFGTVPCTAVRKIHLRLQLLTGLTYKSKDPGAKDLQQALSDTQLKE